MNHPVSPPTGSAVVKTGTRVDVSTADPDIVEFLMSDPSIDASGETIVAEGWDLRRFKKNPVALYGHQQSNLPIGRWENVRVENGALKGQLRLAEEGTSPFIDAVRRLFKQKMLNACSVGFRPIEKEPLSKDADPFWGPFKYLKQQLLECSLCAVGSNPNALAQRAINQFPAEVRSLLIESGDQRRAVVPTGKSAVIPPIKGKTTMSLTERIQALQEDLIRIQDMQAPLHQKLSGGEELTDDEASDFDDNATELAEISKKLDRLRETERSLGLATVTRQTVQTTTPPLPGVQTQPLTRRAPPRSEKPMEMFVKMGTIAFLAHAQKKSPDVVRMERYPDRTDVEAVMKSVTNPAQTTVATWAAELVEEANADWLETLAPISVYGRLVAFGPRFTFGRNGQIKIPKRNRAVRAPGDLRGAFIGEGQPIPVRRGSFGAVTLVPHKFGVISTFTREMAQHSTPAIEALIREGIVEDSAIAIDEALLDNVPADAIRPAGLLNGVVAIPGAVGGGVDAITADLKALLGPFITANAADRLVLLINPINVLKLRWATTPLGIYPFREQVASGTLDGVSIIESTNVGVADLIMLRAADFTSSTNDTPEFDVSDVATIHEDDGGYAVDNASRPGTTTVLPIATGTAGAGAITAAPVRSLWQTATIGVRMLQDIDWAMRRAGVVAYVNAITW